MRTYIYEVVTGHRTGHLPRLIRWGLAPLSWLYGIGVCFRNWLYDRELFRVRRLPCPVISVGNLVAGGTGKTPTVIWVAKRLQHSGFRVAVLLRGYRRFRISDFGFRKGKATPLVVSDGEQTLVSAAVSGDEAAMLASELPGVIVILGKDRYAAGLAAIKIWGDTHGVLILDDGFQHRRLARDLDIVTLDATQPFGTGYLLPAGTLREPKSALRRADVLFLTRTDQAPVLTGLQRFTNRYQIIVESRHRPTRLYRLGTSETIPLTYLEGKCVLAVCAIGNPQAFVGTLNQLGAAQVDLVAFPDHHDYTSKDIARILDRTRRLPDGFIVTTQKDAQKLALVGNFEALVLAVEIEPTRHTERLLECLNWTASVQRLDTGS